VSNSLLWAGLSLLRQPNICKMFFALSISRIGTAMAPIAMAFGVLQLTGSTSDSAIVIASPVFASMVVMLLGGVLADRGSRQRLVVFADALAMLTQTLIALLFLSGLATVPLLTGLMLVSGVAIALNVPASTGLITQLVGQGQLQPLNAILGMGRNGAMAVGAAIGGLLVSFWGAGVALLMNAATFGVSALLILWLKPNHQTPAGKVPMVQGFVQDLKQGWGEFTRHRWLWVVVLQFSLVVAVGQCIFGLLGPAIAAGQMGGAADWGFIAAGYGVGTLIGGLVAIKVRVRYPIRVATLCVFLYAIVPIALAFPLPLYFVVAAAFINGIAGQVFSVLWMTTIQQKIPAQMLSKVIAWDYLGSIALTPLAIIGAGWLFEVSGFRVSMIIAALIVIVATGAALMVRDVRMSRYESEYLEL